MSRRSGVGEADHEREMQPVNGGQKFGCGGPLRAKHAVSLGHGITRSSVARVRAGAEVATSPRLANLIYVKYGNVN
jgi:hypothetical protein